MSTAIVAVVVVFVEASAVVVVMVVVVVVVVGAVVAVEEAERTGAGDELDISAKSYAAGKEQKTRTKPRKLKRKLLEIAMLPRHAPTNTFAKDRSKVGCSSNRGEKRGPDEGGRR
jgi:hypothetical protein